MLNSTFNTDINYFITVLTVSTTDDVGSEMVLGQTDLTVSMLHH